MTGASLLELVAAVRADASLPEVIAAACTCGCMRVWGAGGTRLVQGRLAVGFSLRWNVVLNHSCMGRF